MDEIEQMLELIGKAGEQSIRLNHLSAEMHQDDAQRVVGSIITLKNAVQSPGELATILDPT